VPVPPLSTPLSQLLVAFTIELDNEVERRMAEAAPGSFRISVVMWSNFLRFVGDEIAVGDLVEATGLPKARVLSTLGGMERWRYVTVGPETGGKRDGYGSARGLRPEWPVRPTPTGRAAQELWPLLISEMEARWRGRFGDGEVTELRDAARALVEPLERDLPEYLPVVVGSTGMVSEVTERPRLGPPSDDLLALLAQALLAYTLEFERRSELSLPLAENVVRPLADSDLEVRDLPAVGGVSKEAVAMALTWLTKHGYVEVASKRARLTPQARAALEQHELRHAEVEASFGDGGERLRAAMQPFLDRPDLLAEGPHPPAGGWRGEPPYLAQTERVLSDPLAHLPRHPMVLHRGGWPDGS
jgi:DNA-binding transcriptional ArsR family regulator